MPRVGQRRKAKEELISNKRTKENNKFGIIFCGNGVELRSILLTYWIDTIYYDAVLINEVKYKVKDSVETNRKLITSSKVIQNLYVIEVSLYM